MVIGLVILIVMLGVGAQFADKLAREHGRNPYAWCGLSLLGGLAGYAVGAGLFMLSLAADSSIGFLAALAGPVLGLVFQAITIYMLLRSVERDRRLRQSDWPAYRVSRPGSPGYECRLYLRSDGVYVEPLNAVEALPLRLPYKEIDAAEVSGECVSLRWSDKEISLHPGGNELVSSARTGLSEAISLEIMRRAKAADACL